MKHRLVILVAMALLMVTAICGEGAALAEKPSETVDPAADAAQVIMSVNGETVDRQTVSDAFEYYCQYYRQMNSFYTELGMAPQYPAADSAILDMVLADLRDAMVVRQQAVKLGLDRFTDEELAEIEEAAKAYADANGCSPEDSLKEARNQRLLEKIESYVKDPVTVSDEEIRVALDERVESEKTSYEADKTVFGSKLNNNEVCCYAPAGYRYVKHILIKYTDEDADVIAAVETALNDARAVYSSAQQDGSAAVKEALDAAQTAYDAALAAAAENIRAKADEVYALATAEGADFDALMAEYGEDPGMQIEPTMTNGYAVCEGFPFVEPFLNAALALENTGDVSGPVMSRYGCHIIKYVSDIPEGVRMTLDEAREALGPALLSEKQQTAWREALARWISEADIRCWPERMGD